MKPAQAYPQMFFSSSYGYLRRLAPDDDEDDGHEKKRPTHEATEEELKARAKLGQLLEGDEDEIAKKLKEKELEAERLQAKLKIEKPEGYCSECEDQEATLSCDQCQDIYCFLCYQAQHKKGKRAVHTTKPFGAVPPAPAPAAAASPVPPSANGATPAPAAVPDEHFEDAPTPAVAATAPVTPLGQEFIERCKYIPLRLSLAERKLLRLLEAALKVSEYTDKVDILAYGNKAKRIHTQIREICAILSGLVIANDYTAGQQLLKDRSFQDNAEFFQKIFEIGRRHKIMNPEKMRGEYGKLVYLLQDSCSAHVQELLQFSCKKEIRTVHLFLTERNAAHMLGDELMSVATKEIVSTPSTSRQWVRKEIKSKERAIEQLAQKYQSPEISADDIKLCLYSIGDNNSYLTFNRDPVDKMIRYLTTYFKPEEEEEGFSLSIQSGYGGARLSHSHEVQYHYALQSLTLWREILHDMFKLWYLAETDLLSDTSFYHLTDTGQGLNRVQQSPRVYKAMSGILHKCQHRIGTWVGSSVIHLGDRNVPNALMFIDKYCQVPRILNPIVITLEQIEVLARNEKLLKYINEGFGGVDILRKTILCDFFRHAFDGSGADNFFDAGSCIDGRLTSAWNWCSLLDKKEYYPIFKLTGFIGFDGDFQN